MPKKQIDPQKDAAQILQSIKVLNTASVLALKELTSVIYPEKKADNKEQLRKLEDIDINSGSNGDPFKYPLSRIEHEMQFVRDARFINYNISDTNFPNFPNALLLIDSLKSHFRKSTVIALSSPSFNGNICITLASTPDMAYIFSCLEILKEFTTSKHIYLIRGTEGLAYISFRNFQETSCLRQTLESVFQEIHNEICDKIDISPRD